MVYEPTMGFARLGKEVRKGIDGMVYGLTVAPAHEDDTWALPTDARIKNILVS